MTVVSQINPSPPELSTAFPHETAMAGGSGVGGKVGGNVGGDVTIGGTVGEIVGTTDGDGGGTDGGMVAGGSVGTRVGPGVDDEDGNSAPLAVAVAVEPLGATGDGSGDGSSRCPALGPPVGVFKVLEIGDGRTIGTMAERLGGGKGVGVGDASPTSAMLNKIPNTQVTATIATKGVRSRGTHGTVSERAAARSGRPRGTRVATNRNGGPITAD